MNYTRRRMNRSKKTNRSKRGRSKRNYRKKTNNLKYSRNKNTRKKLGGNKIPFIAALLSHLAITRANLLNAFPELADDSGHVTEETLQGIFTTPITEIDGTGGFTIFNVKNYDPVGMGIETGHIFMVAKDKDTGKIGSIGFYPKNYRSFTGLVGSVFGDTGVLVTPDPIAKKYSREDIHDGDFELLKYDARPIGVAARHAYEILNSTLSSANHTSVRDTHLYETDINYQPLAMGSAENCYTYIQSFLRIELNTISDSAVPNWGVAPSPPPAGAGIGVYGMLSAAGSSVAAMLGRGGGSRKRLRRKSKNKRNNIKKTRRRS
jgi:hypothetical protein